MIYGLFDAENKKKTTVLTNHGETKVHAF